MTSFPGPKKKRQRDPEIEQRRWPRLEPSSVPFLKSVSFSRGNEVRVINISRGGMLLETEVRLRPQMKIHLKLVTSDGVIQLDGSVLRSSIISLKGIPRYQSAIAFDGPFHMMEDISDMGTASEAQFKPAACPATEKGSEPRPADPVLCQFDVNSAMVTFAAADMSRSAVIDMFKRNNL